MSKLLVLLLLSLLIASCSGSKELQLGQTSQDPCRDQTTIKDSREFTGETVENFIIYQQGDKVYASMDVRTHCNAQIAFATEIPKDQIILRLRNANNASSDCVCITRVTTSISNISKGTYSVLVMAPAGNKLLAQQNLTVN
jgi:hypothetical protein